MLLYVAGPYTAPTREEVEQNIAAAKDVAARLWAMGHAVICPHANTAFLDELETGLKWGDFLSGDFNIISRCDGMVMLPGWAESAGAKREYNYALQLGMDVWFAEGMLPALHPTETRCPEQAEAFRETLGSMYRTHLSKNSDYSPANILGTGAIGLMTRLWDKIARLMSLHGFRINITEPAVLDQSREPENESVDDSFLDAANYAVIGLLLRKGKWGR